LAERTVVALGIADTGTDIDDPRVRTVEDLAEWDVLVCDSDPPARQVERAATAGTALVTASDKVGKAETIPIVRDASLRSLARSLAAVQTNTPTMLAWTEPGHPLAVSTIVTFPPPVGKLRARRAPDGALIAPTDDQWAGIVVRSGARIVGVADHAEWLAAIALAAAVHVVPSEPGITTPDDAAQDYLDAAQRAGLETAVFRTS
jgi:hypothetical protein